MGYWFKSTTRLCATHRHKFQVYHHPYGIIRKIWNKLSGWTGIGQRRLQSQSRGFTMRQTYPFTAIVGQERMKRALILNAINP